MRNSLKPSRRRTYLAAAGLTALAAGALTQQHVRAAMSFGSEPVAQDRVIALAQPLSNDRWTLIVLEQREPAPPCWRRNANGSVLTYEMHLPESTCGRYLSGSAYSLRAGGQDLRQPWRLRVEHSNGQLQLLASDGKQTEPIVIGSGQAAGSALVELRLQNNWAFERRTFEGQNLGHLYVSHSNPLPVLLAEARNGGGIPPLLAQLPAPPPPLAPEPRRSTSSPERRSSSRTPAPGAATARAIQTADQPLASSSSSRLARLEALRAGSPRSTGRGTDSTELTPGQTDGVIALQVVPYRP
jgi:N-acetylmuramoyl-L-alanine amidase